MNLFSDRVSIAGFTVGWSAVRYMPEKAAYALFDQFADAAWRKRGKGVLRLEFNLNRVMGGDLTQAEKREMSREGMRSYMRYYCDTFRLPTWSDEYLNSHFEIRGIEKLQNALAKGGAIVSLPHSGNWDAAGAYAALQFGGVSTVAERLKPEEIYEKFLHYRNIRNIEILPHTGGDKPVLATLTDRVRQGRLVALLGDRDLSAKGVEVEFFGHTSKMPTGPAAMAIDSDTPLHPGMLWFEPNLGVAQISDPLPMPTEGDRTERILQLTQSLATFWEAGIREHATDWHMLQKIWLDEPRDLGQ